MLRLTELRLPLDHAPEALEAAVRARLGLADDARLRIEVARRGYDARRRGRIQLVYSLDVDVDDEAAVLAARGAGAGDASAKETPTKDASTLGPAPDTRYRFASAPSRPPELRPVVVGAGPCGVMAALILAQMGLRPIVVERGKAVRERTVDTFALWRRGVLTAESNVQFGEGGAGTFSDGKLYSQIKDPGHYGRKVMREFVAAGAPEEILVLSKPHIGTFRLVSMVERIRAQIEALGGEYRFGTRVEDLVIEMRAGTRQLAGLVLSDGGTLATRHAILALGHSARDSFAMLHAREVAMRAKPFSIGVRIEHPQGWIDRARFGSQAGHAALGAADYKLVHHAGNGRSVYSFCMCPGGTVVAATSEAGQVVTNGMSQYSRAERNANAGIVVGIDPERDYPGGPLAGIDYQRRWERAAFAAGGGAYFAPAQRVDDLLAARASTALGEVVPSYRPGVAPTDLAGCLPDFAIAAIREALPVFGRQIPGFDHPDAVMTGVETRTSSPLRLDRDATLQSVNTSGLFPAGEGAGYAGGILSAGVDGIKVAEAVARAMVSDERRFEPVHRRGAAPMPPSAGDEHP